MSFYYDLFKEMNSVRKNPSGYADKILSYKSYFKDKVMHIPGSKKGISTEEGFSAFEEAAQFLKSSKPVEELSPSKALGRVANDYLELSSHCSPEKINEIDLDSIINKYGSFSGTFHNAMDFGSSTPELVVISLLVSDGDPTRANREFLTNPELKKIGTATGKHDTYGTVTIIVSCTDFKNTYDKEDNELYSGSEVANTTEKTDEEYKIDDPNVVSFSKRERFVIDNGKLKKKITLTKKYKDGVIKKEVKHILL